MGEHSIHVVCGAGMHNVLGLGWGWVGWSWVGWGGVCAVSNVYENNSYSVPIVVCRCVCRVNPHLKSQPLDGGVLHVLSRCVGVV